jgi:hypothetical protein
MFVLFRFTIRFLPHLACTVLAEMLALSRFPLGFSTCPRTGRSYGPEGPYSLGRSWITLPGRSHGPNRPVLTDRFWITLTGHFLFAAPDLQPPPS